MRFRGTGGSMASMLSACSVPRLRLRLRGAAATAAAVAVALTGGVGPAGAVLTKDVPARGCPDGDPYGDVLVVDGPLRIVNELTAYTGQSTTDTEYACLGRYGKPVRVGRSEGGYSTRFVTGTADYVFDGTRYLATLTQTSEPDAQHGTARYVVHDLRTGSVIGTTATPFEPFDQAPVQLTPKGALLGANFFAAEASTPVQVLRGSVRRTLSAAGTDVALNSLTAYWREGAKAGDVAHLAAVDGTAGAGEPHQLGGVSSTAGDLGRCTRLKGTTVAESSGVIVRRTATTQSACTSGSFLTRRLASAGGRVRIVADRWVLLVAPAAGDPAAQRITVLDTSSGKLVDDVTVPAAGAVATTLMNDGTLAWQAPGGPVLAKAAGATVSTELAPAADAATALASAGTTIYWTVAGAARGTVGTRTGFTPLEPAPARSR